MLQNANQEWKLHLREKSSLSNIEIINKIVEQAATAHKFD